MQQPSATFRHPLVTFVMPAYNAADFIGEAIESVCAQSVRDWELIIVDDRSSDSTASIARRYALQDPRITVMQTDRQSGSAFTPRKIAVKAARTPLICAIDADDIIAPDYLNCLLNVRNQTGADVVCATLWTFCDDITTSTRAVPAGDNFYGRSIAGKDAVKHTLHKWHIAPNGLISKKLYSDIYDAYPDFPTHMYADELLSRYILYGAGKVAVSTAAYYYRANPVSVTHKASAKLFHILSNSTDLITFVRDRYSIQSEEYLLAQQQNFFCYYSALLMRRGMRLSDEETREIRTLIDRARAAIDYTALQKHLSLKFRLLHMLPEWLGCTLLSAARKIGI